MKLYHGADGKSAKRAARLGDISCPFCLVTLPRAVTALIEVVDGECPSGCEDALLVKVRCPQCGRLAFAKTIAFPYAGRDDWSNLAAKGLELVVRGTKMVLLHDGQVWAQSDD